MIDRPLVVMFDRPARKTTPTVTHPPTPCPKTRRRDRGGRPIELMLELEPLTAQAAACHDRSGGQVHAFGAAPVAIMNISG